MERVFIKHGNGNFVLHPKKYSTLEDCKQAKKDIQRLLMCLSQDSIYQIVKFLEPYRRKLAKMEEWEDEQSNQEQEKS